MEKKEGILDYGNHREQVRNVRNWRLTLALGGAHPASRCCQARRDSGKANASIDVGDAADASGGAGRVATVATATACRRARGGPVQGGAVRLDVRHLRGRRDHVVVDVLVQVGGPEERQGDGLRVPVLHAVQAREKTCAGVRCASTATRPSRKTRWSPSTLGDGHVLRLQRVRPVHDGPTGGHQGAWRAEVLHRRRVGDLRPRHPGD